MNTTLIHQYEQRNNFGKLMNMNFIVVAEGEVDYFLTIAEQHLATPNAAHGGVISALADAALGLAGLSAVQKENKVVSTVEFKINYLAPARLNDELVAKGRVIQKGTRLLVIECVICCANRANTAVATALGTFNAYDANHAGY